MRSLRRRNVELKYFRYLFFIDSVSYIPPTVIIILVLFAVPTVLFARHVYMNTPLLGGILIHIPELLLSTTTSFLYNS